MTRSSTTDARGSGPSGPLVVRPYEASDRSDCYDVCLRTGAGGQDATGVFSSDELIADIYCGPYLQFEPESAFVVESGGRVVGYVIATADTRGFVDRYRREWLPGFDERHPRASGLSAAELDMIETGRDPQRMLVPELDSHPAHLHIDLLPEAQGRGLGRVLITRLRETLAARGVPGVHLSVGAANLSARAFYARLGFVPLASSTDDAPVLGITTA